MTRERGYSLFQIMVLASVAVLIVVLKVALKVPLKMPGHSGVFWVALLYLGRSLVPRRGAGALAGLMSGMVAAFMVPGGRGPLGTLLQYFAAGCGVEAAFLVLGDCRSWWRALLAGLAGNWTKLLVKSALDLAMGMPVAAALAIIAYPLLTHTVFGLVAGAVGLSVRRALERAGLFAFIGERV